MFKKVFLLLLLLFIVLIDGENNLCESYENNIYQVITSFPSYKSFYSILTFLSNGLSYEINHFANGMNTDELGLDLQFSTHVGSYKCLNKTSVYLISLGYLFKSKDISILSSYDRISRHDYYLYFPSDNSKTCQGEVSYSFYDTGSNPYDINNKQIFSMSIANLTCILLEGRNYTWPTTNK